MITVQTSIKVMRIDEVGMNMLGIIGGLGPMATAYLMQLLTQMSDAGTDQEHMEIVVYSKPSIPDRTQYILGKSDRSPVPEMVLAGRKLVEFGADLIAVPCITAHYFHDELERQIGIPIINAITETVQCIEQEEIDRVGLMATDGTIQSGLFQKELKRHNIQSILPAADGQREIMHMIYEEVKAGRAVDPEHFRNVSDRLFSQGAQVILLGCTELSLIKRDFVLPAGYLDVMDVLARKAVQCCNHVREEYSALITR